MRLQLFGEGAALLGSDVFGLLVELCLQGVPLLNEAGVCVGVEFALPLVESILADDQDLVELLQVRPLRLLLRGST